VSAPWGTDTIVSLPAPLRVDQKPYVDMGGFTFTEHGIAHNFTNSDLEVYLTPTFRPDTTQAK
jgi:hypothetical protein